MAAVSGSGAPNDGLLFCFDAGSARSTNRKKFSSNKLQPYTAWTEGTGNSTGYSSNGSSTEQLRAYVNDDPWGGRSIIWRTTPDAVSGADGGWNTTNIAPDENSLYRASVWVRRHTSGTGGTFYLGQRASPDPIRNDTDVAQSNPYFTYPSQASLTQNQWYFVCYHIFPRGYTGGRHPDSGWYENGAKITDKSYGNVGTQDIRWAPGTTSTYHSVYHFYTTNTSSGLEFAAPRLDLCDGTEPSITSLMSTSASSWTDASRKMVGAIQSQTAITWADTNRGTFSLDGTSYIAGSDPGYPSAWSDNFSFEAVIRIPSGSDWHDTTTFGSNTATCVVGRGSYGGSHGLGVRDTNLISHVVRTDSELSTANYSASFDTWYHCVGTWDGSNNRLYINGELSGNDAVVVSGVPDAGTVRIGGNLAFGGNNGGYFEGDIAVAKMFNRTLSASEVKAAYLGIRGRFGI